MQLYKILYRRYTWRGSQKIINADIDFLLDKINIRYN